MDSEDQLEIEKLGGLAGIGLPGSRIRSRVLLVGSELSADERKSIATLFKADPGAGRPAPAGSDGFRFRISLDHEGVRREIEVGERELIESLQTRVHDELI